MANSNVLFVWVDNYCRDHPDEDIEKAGEAFVRQHPRYGRASTRPFVRPAWALYFPLLVTSGVVFALASEATAHQRQHHTARSRGFGPSVSDKALARLGAVPIILSFRGRLVATHLHCERTA